MASLKATPVSEELALGLDRLKDNVAVPFNVTLDAPNDFKIVGGRMAGGGEDPPDEPPPQAKQPKELRMITMPCHRRGVIVGNSRLAPGRHAEGP
jgi:hypothetical protein